MASKYQLAKSAARDINSIAQYLSSGLKTPQASRAFLEEFKHQLELTCVFSESHPLCPHPELAARGYRSFRVGRYLALYSFDSECVRVLHVFHQSQNYAHDVITRGD